jgi:hypothetical protein
MYGGMYQAILITHSSLRWALLILFPLTIILAWLVKSSPSEEKLNRMNLIAKITMGLSDSMLVLGLYLMHSSPIVQSFFAGLPATMKDSVLRKAGLEHPFIMILSLIIMHIGFAVSKRKEANETKSKWVLISYSISLILILIGIPWNRL